MWPDLCTDQNSPASLPFQHSGTVYLLQYHGCWLTNRHILCQQLELRSMNNLQLDYHQSDHRQWLLQCGSTMSSKYISNIFLLQPPSATSGAHKLGIHMYQPTCLIIDIKCTTKFTLCYRRSCYSTAHALNLAGGSGQGPDGVSAKTDVNWVMESLYIWVSQG